MPTSYNGWTVLNWGDPAIDPNFTVAGHKFPAGVLRGPVSTVLKYVAEQLNARVESIDPDQDEWGHDYRLNRNADNWSCHASATAIDYNAQRHGNGARGTFTSKQVAEIRKILAEVGNVVRWGGDFTGTVDEMHFEINASELAVTTAAARLYNPSTDWFVMATQDDLTAVVKAQLAALNLPKLINDTVANVLRAPEFKLDADRRGQDAYRDSINATRGWARETRFPGWDALTPKE